VEQDFSPSQMSDPITRQRIAHHLSSKNLRNFVLTAALVAAGCSRGEPLFPVSGVVTLSGKPLAGASITLYPDATKGNQTKRLPAGPSNAKGEYRLYTLMRSGAPAGWYKVVVFASETPKVPDAKDSKKNQTALPKSIINARYNQESTTPLSVEVKAAAPPGAYDLKLEP
jgi:hypothetical protein